MGQSIAYFGYGSLVNLATLRTAHLAAHPARLTGWRRAWLARPDGVGGQIARSDLAFLSAVPDPDCTIEGLVIVDEAENLPALDRREALYRRLVAPVACDAGNWHEPRPPTAFLYAADAPRAGNASILRSYLDAVMQGYLHRFGERGLLDFLATTDGFDLPVIEDRDAPIYPRAVRTSVTERARFDALVPPRS